MHIYAIFLPSGLSPLRAAEQAVLERQGFTLGAFLLTPVWALRHGLWLAALLWLLWVILIASTSSMAHFAPHAAFAVYFLGALAFGLEADRFRQASLSRSGFLLRGLTLGASIRDAEQLFFARRSGLMQPPSLPAKPTVVAGDRPHPAAANIETDLLGLFPPGETEL